MLITNYFDWRADFDTLLRYSGAFPLSFSETRLQTSCLLMDMRPKKGIKRKPVCISRAKKQCFTSCKSVASLN